MINPLNYNIKLTYTKTVLLAFLSLMLVFFSGLPLLVQGAAASLYLFPSTGIYTVGNIFSVQVKVNSGGVAINAADGILVFDVNDLEVKGISKEDSIFTLWVQEPVFSNSLGTINFAGGKPSPGFTGAAGTIFSITFKARTSGTTNLTFASGSVLADDGKGTNILANLGSGVYILTGREITPLPPPIPEQPPIAPIISSLTHPNENKWYSNDYPEFTWKLPLDVTGVSLLFNKNSIADPGPISDGLIDSKKFENVEDGIWYFHIKFQNQYGWGEITHRKVLIDTQPPPPFSIEVQREDPTDPQPVIMFETTDELSGIEYYELKIGEGEPFLADITKIKSYQLPLQAPGKHLVKAKAFDKAKNYTLSSTEIEILPIESPIVTKFPKGLLPDQNLALEGKGLSEVMIRIFVQRKGESPILNGVKTDGAGNWSFISPGISEKGDYEVWVEAQDKRGAQSLPSKKISFWVGLPPFIKFGKIVIDYLNVMITLIVLIIGAVVVIFYGRYRISLWRGRLRRETKELAQTLFQAFKTLRKEVQEQVEYLDGKAGLNEDEKKLRDRLKKALGASEKFISKEIKDIEKELE